MTAQIIPFPQSRSPRLTEAETISKERQEYLARVRQVAADIIAAVKEQRVMDEGIT